MKGKTFLEAWEEEWTRWQDIRSKNLLGRIRYNRKYHPREVRRRARILARWLDVPKEPSWTSYIATFKGVQSQTKG